MTNLTIDGLAIDTTPFTLGLLDCGDDFTSHGHIMEGTEFECPEHCILWETVGSRVAENPVHTFLANNITIA